MFNRKLKQRVEDLEERIDVLSATIGDVPYIVQLEFAKQQRLSRFAELKPMSTVYVSGFYVRHPDLEYRPVRFLAADDDGRILVWDEESGHNGFVNINHVHITNPKGA